MKIEPVSIQDAALNSGLFQSRFWAAFKKQRGYEVQTFMLEMGRRWSYLVTVNRPFRGGNSYRYVPYGPELRASEGEEGRLLEETAEQLRAHLPRETTFLRFDLPWESPYSTTPPPSQIRELRMNFGSRKWNLRKAPTDIQPTDTVIIPLGKPSGTILAGMKKKTRYNLRLAFRRDVATRFTGQAGLENWYRLYRQTAERKGIVCEKHDYFKSLFTLSKKTTPEILLCNAYYKGRTVAGILVALYKKRAYYLFGASDYTYRNLMAPYAVQWRAMMKAKECGCTSYDLYGISPFSSPGHPLYGLYRFKTGFGGEVHHFRGCWDYPFDNELYEGFSISAGLHDGYHVEQ